MNADTEYANSLGIHKGDTLYLGRFRDAVDGDLYLVEINGIHQIDTYDEVYTDLEEYNSIGVILGCYKHFKESGDDILDAAVLEVENA